MIPLRSGAPSSLFILHMCVQAFAYMQELSIPAPNLGRKRGWDFFHCIPLEITNLHLLLKTQTLWFVRMGAVFPSWTLLSVGKAGSFQA
ncbi:hypothetical protein B0T13DRAFT_481175 [Neurospora crassa]|nr:hypothetical protein B0T13DRAFT_481175 [Neurospora crassa]